MTTPTRRGESFLALIITLCAAAIAGCNDATSPKPLAYQYDLKAVRGVPLPATGVRSQYDSVLIQGGGLTFIARDSVIFSMSDSIIYTDDPAVSGLADQKRDFSVKTRYSRRGTQVVLQWTEFDADTGFVNGDTLVLQWHDPNSFGPTTELLYTAVLPPR